MPLLATLIPTSPRGSASSSKLSTGTWTAKASEEKRTDCVWGRFDGTNIGYMQLLDFGPDDEEAYALELTRRFSLSQSPTRLCLTFESMKVEVTP